MERATLGVLRFDHAVRRLIDSDTRKIPPLLDRVARAAALAQLHPVVLFGQFFNYVDVRGEWWSCRHGPVLAQAA
jgi:hypothetical protein